MKKLPCCYLCLSIDRKLVPLNNDAFLQLYQIIMTPELQDSPINFKVCWECTAFMKRIAKFKMMVLKAQEIVKLFVLNYESEPPNSLSSLQTHYNTHLIKIKHNNNQQNIKTEVNIKEEPEIEYLEDFQNVCADYLNSDIADITVNIKEDSSQDSSSDLRVNENSIHNGINIEGETVNQSLNIKSVTNSKLGRKLKKQYCLVRANRSVELINKLKIEPKDLYRWMESERNSEFFKSKKHKCNLCALAFHNINKLYLHNKNFHTKGVGKFTCAICQCNIKAKNLLSTHIKRHYFILQCAVCNYQCYSRIHMRFHTSTHTHGVQCKHCPGFFRTTREFHQHYRRLHRLFKCDHCTRVCKEREVMIRHLSRHKEWACDSCGARYKRKDALQQHMQSKHDHSKEQTYCVPCGRHYANTIQYKRHLKESSAHAHERPVGNTRVIPCPSCDKTYTRREFMKNHYRLVHEGKTKFYCNDCNRHFLNSSSYARHRNIHDGVKKEKNKLCTICGRGFSAKKTLEQHVLTHTGERPYACGRCGARFTQRYAAMTHAARVHRHASPTSVLYEPPKSLTFVKESGEEIVRLNPAYLTRS